MAEPNAILAINSLDRYNKNQGINGQPASFSTSLVNQYNKTGQPCNDFQVGGFGALIYGYIKKIVVSQTQFEYNVPTVIPDRNDTLVIRVQELNSPFTIATAEIRLPFGYYTPSELAGVLQIQLNNSILDAITPIIVEYRSDYNDFTFTVLDYQNYQMWFLNVPDLIEYYGTINPTQYLTVLKCYRLVGINIDNRPPARTQSSKQSAQFLYTPYVDIFSTTLTKYQKVKDNTTSASSDSTLVARIFLSGEGTPQNSSGEIQTNINDSAPIQPIANTNYAYPLGSRPFLVVQDCNTPKVIRWNKDETVYALDFQLRDQYGDLLFTQYGTPVISNTSPIYYSEFQMTLVCVEGER